MRNFGDFFWTLLMIAVTAVLWFLLMNSRSTNEKSDAYKEMKVFSDACDGRLSGTMTITSSGNKIELTCASIKTP